MRLSRAGNFSPSTLAAACLAASLAGCSDGDAPFTQRDGFDEIRAMQSGELPTAGEMALLERHAPRLFVAEGAEGPIDFYGDYVASGTLTVPGREPDLDVTREDLEAAKGELEAVFEHVPTGERPTPVGYGSVYRAEVGLGEHGGPDGEWTFLRYHFVFRTSGIAMGVGGLRKALLALAGDLDDWHQLDHYTSAVVVLDDSGEAVAVMLQQHNYMRTYLVGEDPAFPVGGPFTVDVAMRSNELYPHRGRAAVWRAASFLAEETAGWMAGVTDQMPALGTHDHTSPDREVDYALRFLPPDDAFYVFEGRLGERRRLPGRDGPPGAIYYTLPEIWRYEVSLPMFYWYENDQQYADIYEGVDWQSLHEAVGPLRSRLAAALVEGGLSH